ncbi:RNA 3'-terminal phosphate cyclase [Aquisphaera insulae]|uniref:RNA 3'-terminal phosphate cyclase n=1 Tax=Aquisphaera insulae TaxID=2712864 RepID=UPI00196B3127|nr:RNA 3'-terminal phosphate cyclase [Aquisphaera insulae]
MSSPSEPSGNDSPVVIDGSRGEGGGQILRTALSLSLLTGRGFRMTKIRANRDKPGLRPQHLKAVEAAAQLGGEVVGAEVGSRELVFRPRPYAARDMKLDIGTAGSAALVLQTLHLPLAMRAESAVRVVINGGTFNPKAPAFPFLDETWRAHMSRLGLSVSLAMPAAGFYPRGGGRLDAWIEPGRPAAKAIPDRGRMRRIRGVAGVCNLRDDIAARIRDRALMQLDDSGLNSDIEIDVVRWPGPGQGAAIAIWAEHQDAVPATFVGLGERGKPAEAVADEAVEELLDFEAVEPAAMDPHSADQVLLPLALADGPSSYSVNIVTEHLRTNAATIRQFLDREITIEESSDRGVPARVTIA